MKNLIKSYEECFRVNRDLPVLTDYVTSVTLTYGQLAQKVDAYHRLFRSLSIEKGDKIAFAGRNGLNWIVTYVSVITYGAVAVPILADFNPADIEGIVTHSDSKLFFADRQILDKMNIADIPGLSMACDIDEVQLPENADFDIETLKYADVGFDDLVIISYTSGTTGTSKGVMLPLRSLCINVDFAVDHNFHFKGSRVLALLPLAHAYGCAFDMLTPLSTGSHIYVLGKMPAPAILLKALATVKPHLLCAVPLIMEKTVRKSVMPKLKKWPVCFLLCIPFVRSRIFKKVRSTMLESFGGCIKEINLGGAALAKDVEKFLRKIHFPFTVGYGMTETGPLISYATWDEFKPGSCGKLLPSLEVKLEGDYGKGIGEICVKGTNVMMGYYKNPKATAAALQDGWLHTGDIGEIDREGNIFLRGRCKSMILTSSGQNIYPEEIEAKLNNLPGVGESLVYEENGKLYALAVADAEFLKKCDGNYETVKTRLALDLTALNLLVAPYERVSEIKLCSEPFEKTPKQSIKRFLYPKAAKLV